MEAEYATGSDECPDYCSRCSRRGKESEAKYFCTSCDRFYCQRCLDKRHRHVNGHAWFDITGTRSSEVEECPVCQSPDQKATEYCKEHDQVVCLRCAWNSHRRCQSVSPITDLARGIYTSDGFISMAVELEKRLKNIEDLLAVKKRKHEEIKLIYGRARDNIRQLASGKADNVEEETNYEINEVYYEIENDSNSDIDNCKDALSNVRFYKFLMDRKKLTEKQMFIKLRQMRSGLIRYDKVIHDATKTTHNLSGFAEYIESTVSRFADDLASLRISST